MTNETTYDPSTFSKEGKIEDVKIGTKIWFEDSEVGVVIADEEHKFMVKWSSGICQTLNKSWFNRYWFNKYWGIVVENKEEQPKQEQNQHKYYDVILHWANIKTMTERLRFLLVK